MVKCSYCGSHMPEGSVYCQNCGKALNASSASDVLNNDSPDRFSSDLMDHLNKISRRLGWAARPVGNLPPSINGFHNLLMVSPGMSILFILADRVPSEDQWEDVVLAKFRYVCDVSAVCFMGQMRTMLNGDRQIQLAKAGIVTSPADQMQQKLSSIDMNGSSDKILSDFLAALGIRNMGDGRYAYSMNQQSPFSDIASSVKSRLQDLMRRGNSP